MKNIENESINTKQKSMKLNQKTQKRNRSNPTPKKAKPKIKTTNKNEPRKQSKMHTRPVRQIMEVAGCPPGPGSRFCPRPPRPRGEKDRQNLELTAGRRPAPFAKRSFRYKSSSWGVGGHHAVSWTHVLFVVCVCRLLVRDRETCPVVPQAES